VVAPHQLDDASVYAIDQFLMRGGTVVLATSPFTSELSGGSLELRDWNSGLQSWLAYMGIAIDDTLVLDRQNAPFAAPILRQGGDYEFRDVKMVDYPYFIDLRAPGLATNHPVTANLPQVTMAWASPVTVTPARGQRLSQLLRSSERAWTSDDTAITPTVDDQGLTPMAPAQADAAATGARQLLGFSLQGRFSSFFADQGVPAQVRDALEREGTGTGVGVQGALQRSPESARIVLFASNDFMDDQVLANMVTASGTQYLGPLELFMNTLDWALQDDQLLSIRNRAHFNRTLPPMERRGQQVIEYINYGLSLLWLALLALLGWLSRLWRRRRYRKALEL
jgi:ABC-2 type transport system permease protein